MKTLFIQIKCALGMAYETASAAIEEVPQISEVYSISGQYDLLMKCYLEEDEDIGNFVTHIVQKLPGIKDTFTIITFKAF